MFDFSPFCETIFPFFIIGIYWGFLGRSQKHAGRDKVDKDVGLENGKAAIWDFNILKDELDWTAHEAEVANIRSEVLMRRLLHLEEDVGKVKESVKMSLDIFLEIDRKLGNLEKALLLGGKIIPNRSSRERRSEIAKMSNERLSFLEQQVLDLLSANGPMSARDLQVKIGKSREHVSRILGKLVELEMLRRNRLGRQFTYNVIYERDSSNQKDSERNVGSSTT